MVVQFERGEAGLRALGHDADVIVIVDVLPFSTAVWSNSFTRLIFLK